MGELVGTAGVWLLILGAMHASEIYKRRTERRPDTSRRPSGPFPSTEDKPRRAA